MIVYKCPNCAGEMSIDRTGALYCEFCGSKLNFSDKQLEGYREFRKQMLTYLRNLHDLHSSSEAEHLWSMADTEEFESESGTPITINYLFKATDGHADMYVTKANVLYVFPAKYASEATMMEAGLAKLKYPAADIKGLRKCFPIVTGKYYLKDGSVLVSTARDATVFPLSMYGALPPHHVAWIISRLENIACVLEFSNLVHGGISMDNVFINPVTHEAVLYGGWYAVSSKSALSPINRDLCDIRATAKKQLGCSASDAPKEMLAFLDEKPSGNAYDDFSVWDKVIEEGFGGHEFKKMNVDENMSFT